MQIKRGVAIQSFQTLPSNLEPTTWVQHARQAHQPAIMALEAPGWHEGLVPWIQAGFRVTAPFQDRQAALTLSYDDDDSWRSRIKFQPLSSAWVDTIVTWFQSPAVKTYYAVHPYSDEDIHRRFTSYLCIDAIHGYIICLDDKPVGYVQYTTLLDFPCMDYELPPEIEDSAVSLEIFIGDDATVYQGLGGVFMQQFLKRYVWQKYQYCFVDPWDGNTQGLRFYQRQHFHHYRHLEAEFSDHPNVWVQVMMARHPQQLSQFWARLSTQLNRPIRAWQASDRAHTALDTMLAGPWSVQSEHYRILENAAHEPLAKLSLHFEENPLSPKREIHWLKALPVDERRAMEAEFYSLSL